MMENKLNEFSQQKKWRFCRGSLAWLGRQTHNLEIKGLNALRPEVTGSNPVPGTNLLKLAVMILCFKTFVFAGIACPRFTIGSQNNKGVLFAITDCLDWSVSFVDMLTMPNSQKQNFLAFDFVKNAVFSNSC